MDTMLVIKNSRKETKLQVNLQHLDGQVLIIITSMSVKESLWD
eukprot:UN08880